MMKLLERFFDALYPEHVACFICDEEKLTDENQLCQSCAEQLVRCQTLQHYALLDGLYAAFYYTPLIQQAIHRLKYAHGAYLAKYFAAYIDIPTDWMHADCFVPVPLHKKRQKERNYNQSLLVAKELQRRCGIPVEDQAIKRIQNTPKQTGLSEQQRKTNVEKAFSACKSMKGKTVILVDDVVTTGSTLRACAKVLRQAGAAKVYAACICVRK